MLPYVTARDSLTPKQKRLVNVMYETFFNNVRIECGIDTSMLSSLSYDERAMELPWLILSRIAYLLQDKLGKRKALFFWGPPSSGKSLMCSILSSVVPDDLVGQFNMCGMRSSFWLQSLLHKALYIGEEIVLEEVSAQTLKLLCEGSRSNYTDVKFADAIKIEPRPTIVTSNVPPYVHGS